jgi:hypothetical protein
MGFANVPGFGAQYRGGWGRAPPRGPREAPVQYNTGARVLARGRYLRKSRKKSPGKDFLRILSLYGDLIWELSGACSRHAPPSAPTVPIPPGDPTHRILDPK